WRCPSRCATPLPLSSTSITSNGSSKSALVIAPIQRRGRGAAQVFQATMSADESYLARWSRRKRGAATAGRDRPTPERTEDRTPSEASSSAQEPVQLVDLASLPPIESIGAGSDIRAFLAPGVPADLARAALRSAWSADPAIRDF